MLRYIQFKDILYTKGEFVICPELSKKILKKLDFIYKMYENCTLTEIFSGRMIRVMFYFVNSHENALKLERLYAQHRVTLFNVAYEILHDHGLAEDAVHDTFVRIMGNLHKIDESDPNKTRAFLCIICRHVSFDIYNCKIHLNTDDSIIDKIDADESKDPLEIVVKDEGNRKIINYIKKLNKNYQDVILLRYYMGFNYKEISKMLHIKPATARKQVQRAKEQLYLLLKKTHQDITDI